MNPLQLGGLIHKHRTAAGLSLGQLEEKTKINRGNLHKIEQGTTERPSPMYLRRIADALGTEVEDYMSLAGYSAGLPSLAPYLRARYRATPETAAQVEAYFRFLQQGGDEPKNPQTEDPIDT